MISSMKRKIYSSLLLSIISLTVFSQSVIPGLNNLSKDSLLKTVTSLSSKEFDGRNPGTVGYEKAASFMAGQFKKIGLIPLGDSSYYQFLTVEGNEIVAPCRFNRVENGKIAREYKLGDDFVCRGFTGSGKISAPVVFCGYGISQPDKSYDDYEKVDVKNKIVMIFKANPKWTIKDNSWTDDKERSKGLIALQHKASAVLYVSLPNDKNPQKTIGSTLHGKGVQLESLPQLHISLAVAEEFLSGSGYTLSQLQTLIDSLKKPKSLEIGYDAALEVQANYKSEVKTENLIGYIPGTDSLLKNQYVIIGAHLDHVGSQGGQIYFPGANDNASGSSAVLEIAKTFAKNNIKPKRSVIFILFASEEQGLMGSEYCADHLPVPVDSVVAMINMDCIGYGDSIQIGNGKSAPMLWKMIKAEDSLFTKQMVTRTWNNGGADLGAFHKKGIPGAYFVTTNSYVHLHYITDTPETLNLPLYESIARLAYITTYRLAMGEYNREKVLK
jgi:aminopeptidase YwaD